MYTKQIHSLGTKILKKVRFPKPKNESNELIKCFFFFFLYYTKYNFIEVKVIEFQRSKVMNI